MTLHTQTKSWISSTAATIWSSNFGSLPDVQSHKISVPSPWCCGTSWAEASHCIHRFHHTIIFIIITVPELNYSPTCNKVIFWCTAIPTTNHPITLGCCFAWSVNMCELSGIFRNLWGLRPCLMFPPELHPQVIIIHGGIVIIRPDPENNTGCPGVADKHTEAERHRLEHHQPFGTHKTSPGGQLHGKNMCGGDPFR